MLIDAPGIDDKREAPPRKSSGGDDHGNSPYRRQRRATYEPYKHRKPMNIQGGGLSFDISGTNKQLISVLNESKKAIQEFQGAAVLGGKQMDGAFYTRRPSHRQSLCTNRRVVVDTNKAAIAELEAEYKRLGVEASKALSAGHKEEAAALQTKQAQLREEINLRQNRNRRSRKAGRRPSTRGTAVKEGTASRRAERQRPNFVKDAAPQRPGAISANGRSRTARNGHLQES